jgi:hypothetical protein
MRHGYKKGFDKILFNLITNQYLIQMEKTKVMEFIYIPEILPLEKQEIIESYLSIKYGISLEKSKNYYSLKGQKNMG